MVYVVSDIHGDYYLFMKLLNKINFSSKDKMIILGDIVEKGKESLELLKLFFGEHKENFECLMGNHEHDFLKYYYSLLNKNHSEEKILKLCNEYLELLDGLTLELINELEVLPYFKEEKDFICARSCMGYPRRHGKTG